ncbi:permease [Carbonactinospora thermoautotrophica]|uniref:Permease n=3 Tax=Carbonactinospora thermoautotrophica TaxID=1469144 RepID=A0A132MM48_9ACTN|nr:ABC transporter permease [Carbonactinospora thermoautotrophica]KWW97582.1 permease [Carbonactinospora thermoautotrophica]KWW98932.1 Macrolide export ATP-binding/permease protein MacB [Carbonactinospora thermoautotrophica]
MRAGEAFRVAVDSLRANRLRSVLTMLGVIIGVAAVVVLVAIGSGAKREVETQVQGLGSNLILVVPGKARFGSAPSVSRLTLEDTRELTRIVGNPDAVAATVASGETLRAGQREFFGTVNGVTDTVPQVFDRPVARGRYLTAADVATRRRVAVLGSVVAQRLFPDEDPVGRQVSIAGVRFRVIGVLAEKGTAFGVSVDEDTHIPLTTAQRLFGVDRVDALAVKAPSTESIEELQASLIDALKAKYPGEEFSAVTQTQILGTIGRILGMLTGVLAAIAGISLLVGGVGVSNIMLVSVRERTREIGLRKALGARQRDILAQFLIEAVLLTTIGGVIGIGLGVGVSLLLEWVSPVPSLITWWSPLLAFGVSAAVGVFFGVVPARRASRLDPVVALRTE